MCCMHGAACLHAGPINGEDMPPPQRETLTTTVAASPGVQKQVPGGWIVVAGGRHAGWQYSLDNREWVSVVPFLPILAPPSGNIWWRAPSGSAGDLIYEAWHPTAWEKVGRFAVNVQASSKSSSSDPTGANPPQRVALATGVATLISFSADTVKAVLKGKAGNAAMAFVGTTAANVLVATTRFEISQDFVIDVYPGTTVYVTGTTGDHVDVWEYEGT